MTAADDVRQLLELVAWARRPLRRLLETAETDYHRTNLRALLMALDETKNPRLRDIVARHAAPDPTDQPRPLRRGRGGNPDKETQ